MQTPAMGASEPMFNLPRVVVLLAGVMVAMQFMQILLPTEESLQFLRRHQDYRHIKRMVLELEGRHKEAASLR